jgi:D-beta-D-heptose 7-phosphate kinase/D-beta-D-heptose 1-phosphate adenosyltransferase
MMQLYNAFSQLNPQKVLVAGDLLLDTYTIGKARRISPEAPVAVVQAQKQEKSAGGAGNTVLNLISLGAEVSLLSRVGEDAAGETLLSLLAKENVNTRGVLFDPEFPTPIKNRIIADSQQIVRVDHEKVVPLNSDIEKHILELLPDMLKRVQVVAISDYGKGFLTPSLLQALIQTARSLGIYVIADPKGTDFSRYSGVSILKPNLGEAYAAARLPPHTALDQVAGHLFNTLDIQSLAITRSEDGISLFERGNLRRDFPVVAKQVKDVTGAGDTVLAMMAFACANSLPLPAAIELSNVAAGIAIEQAGCAKVTLSQLAKRLLSSSSSHKIFDAHHLHALKAALENTPCHVVPFSGNSLPHPEEIVRLQEKKKTAGNAIVAVIEQEPFCEYTIATLASIQTIDFIVLRTSFQKVAEQLPSGNL